MDSTCLRLIVHTSNLVRASEVTPYTGKFFGLHRQRRHPGCMFPTSLKHRSPSKTVFSARKWRACHVTTRWRARLRFMITSRKVSETHSPLEKAQVGSGLPLWVSRAFFLVLGELNSKKATPVGRGLSLWERCLPPRGRSLCDVWILSFPSVDLKVAVSWRKKRKKAMSMNEWQLFGLSRYSFG